MFLIPFLFPAPLHFHSLCSCFYRSKFSHPRIQRILELPSPQSIGISQCKQVDQDPHATLRMLHTEYGTAPGRFQIPVLLVPVLRSDS